MPSTSATTPAFDPSQSVQFDLDRGQIGLRGAGERVLVPADALLALLAQAGAQGFTDFGLRIGHETGRRAAERLGDVRSASAEAVIDHLGGDLALLGLGSLELERWGRALIFAVEHSPFGDAGDALLAAVLQGALNQVFDRTTAIVRLERNERRARFLVTSEAAAKRVEEWLSSGTSWGEALARLDRGES